MRRPWQKFSIANRNGLNLAALFCGINKSESDETPQRTPVVIICHGFTGSKEGGGRALEMGEILAEQGCGCLLFDFSGCGESEGVFEEISLTRHIEDLASVARWCYDAGFGPIILIGRSFGGAVALSYAAANADIAGVCTWAAPARPVELFRKFAGEAVEGPAEERLHLAGEEGVVTLRKGFFYDLENHDILACAARVSPRPLLVVHGTADEVVCSKEARLIADAAGEPKQIMMIEGADHRFSENTGELWRVFIDWLKKHWLGR